jgi:hypothetical protein
MLTKRKIGLMALFLVVLLSILFVTSLWSDNRSKLTVADIGRIRYGAQASEVITVLGEESTESFRVPTGIVYIWNVRDGGLIRMECNPADEVTVVMPGQRLSRFQIFCAGVRGMLGL